MDIKVEDDEVSEEEAIQSIKQILEKNKLLSMSTVEETSPHINTAFFTHQDLKLYIFTPPDTIHGKNLDKNPEVAVDVHDSHQEWTDDKKGLQIFGKAEIQNTQEVLDLYCERFPEMKELASDQKELDQYDSEFYVIKPERIKIFDEPRFGTENWINVVIN